MSHLPRRNFLLGAGAAAAIGPASAGREPTVPWASAEAFAGGIGVNTHLFHKDSVYDRDFDSSILPALLDLGVARIREGAYDTPLGAADPYYLRIRRLARAGFRFSAVCFDPTDPYVTTPPRRVPEIFDWFEGAIDTLEGSNEPNLLADPARNPGLSAAHQRALFATARRTPSMSAVRVAAPSYIQGSIALAEPLMQAVDLSNLHSYTGMEHPETTGSGRLAGYVEGLRRVNGLAAPIITETGYHTALATTSTHLPVSEDIRARYIPRLLLWAHLAGIRHTYLYELRSTFGRGPGDPESAFGLLTHEGAQTASYRAVKALIALFRARPAPAPVPKPDPAFAVLGDRGDVVLAPFRRADGSAMLAAWLGLPAWDPGTRTSRPPLLRRLELRVDGPNRSLTVHRFGDDGGVTRSPLPLADGRCAFVISDQLQVIDL